MKRWLVALLVLALQSTAVLADAPADGNFVEGIEYKRIVPQQPTQAPDDKIEVAELFWYGCPHCNRLEPALGQWVENKPDDVAFRRIPAQLNPGWKIHAAAFYTAQVLGVVDKIHKPLFDAIHKERRYLRTEDELAEFFADHGVSESEFRNVFSSFAVRAKLARADTLVRSYGAHSVPTIVVNGKYRTDVTMAGGTHKDLFEVINYLIEKERSAES